MKSLSIVFIVVGYYELKILEKENQRTVEYRFIPRSLLDDQYAPVNLERSFTDMFREENPFLYRDTNIENSNLI
jgi:hypothetical protein